MGLDVVVGILADAEDEDSDVVREDLVVIRELLEEAGAGPWTEPEPDGQKAEWLDFWGYSSLHTVRRLAVHLVETGSLPEPLNGQSATKDPLLEDAYLEVPGDTAGGFDHLVHHSDCEGYYVPVDFEEVIIDERLTGAYLGSSVRLLAEARAIAAALGLPEDLDPGSDEVSAATDAETPNGEGWQRYATESYICLQLINAAKHSIKTGAAIVFC
ncbi:hypothetical protein [Actinomadura sp. DC4]|uniref:hypothetical protein n=1 Tax=Actinomadura sp. DC4 TaxID=3055069 RepID=UPI0025AFF8EC|nr:hypothetical protein [Actinomadura sp. DC4]MDN3353030.1 hypothetical protein [Actinomadura sp. DC4]